MQIKNLLSGIQFCGMMYIEDIGGEFWSRLVSDDAFCTVNHSVPLKMLYRSLVPGTWSFSFFVLRIVFEIFPFGPGNRFQYHNFICFNLALFNGAFKYFSLYNVVDNELEILYKDPVVTLFELLSGKFL